MFLCGLIAHLQRVIVKLSWRLYTRSCGKVIVYTCLVIFCSSWHLFFYYVLHVTVVYLLCFYAFYLFISCYVTLMRLLLIKGNLTSVDLFVENVFESCSKVARSNSTDHRRRSGFIFLVSFSPRILTVWSIYCSQGDHWAWKVMESHGI